MPPSRESPLQFLGPFRGLNTTIPAARLPMDFAAIAENVLLANGRIEPGPLWRRSQQYDWDTYGRIVGMFHWDREPGSEYDPFAPGLVLLMVTANGALWSVAWEDQDPPGPVLTQLASGLSGYSPCFVPANNQVYILDGGVRCWATDGTIEGTRWVGLAAPTEHPTRVPPPPQGMVEFWGLETSQPYPRLDHNNEYQIGVSLYDADHDIESSMLVSEECHTDVAGAIGMVYVIFLNRFGEMPPAQEHVTHYRTYVKDITRGDPFVLYMEDAADGGPDIQRDVARYDADGVEIPWTGSTVTGPFGPTRRGLPPRSKIGAYYKDRMIYGDLSDGRFLAFSEWGKPDAVAAVSRIPLEGAANDDPTGMAVLSGQLAVGKENSIWLINGEIIAPTDESVALGQPVELILPDVYRTKAQPGCANTEGGNGMIVTGDPQQCYYNAADGFYRFDGVQSRQVSDLIRPTWCEFVTFRESIPYFQRVAQRQRITYAIDTLNGVLYMAQHQRLADDARDHPQILAYHYKRDRGDGIGVWTVLRFRDDLDDDAECVHAICSSLGRSPAQAGGAGIAKHYEGLIAVAGNDPTWRIHRADHLVAGDPAIHHFCGLLYQTGRVPLAGEEHDCHVYYFNLFLIPVASGPTWELRLIADGDWQGPMIARPVNTDRGRFLMPVGYDAHDFTVQIRGEIAPEVFKPELGVRGWSFDLEPTGQR